MHCYDPSPTSFVCMSLKIRKHQLYIGPQVSLIVQAMQLINHTLATLVLIWVKWNLHIYFRCVKENGGKGVLCVRWVQSDVTSVLSMAQSWHRYFHLFSAVIVTNGT